MAGILDEDTLSNFSMQIENILNACPAHLHNDLLSLIQEFSKQKLTDLEGCSSDENDEIGQIDDLSKQIFILNGIRQDLQHELPLTCELESEKLFYPEDSCEVSVDAFVYDAEELDLAVEQGDISLHRCRKCGSRDVQKLEVVTHSLSVGEMVYIYRYMLPHVLRRRNRTQTKHRGSNYSAAATLTHRGREEDGETTLNSEASEARRTSPNEKPILLDIGSRTGAVLFGAYYLYEKNVQLYGVEVNKAFADLSMKIAMDYKIPAFKVFADDIMAEGKGHASLLQSAQIVVMHNVFEYFAEPEKQIRLWQFCLENLRKNPDLLLITSPSLKDSLSQLKMPAETWSFMRPVKVPSSVQKEFLDRYSERLDIDKDQLASIKLYSHGLPAK